MKNKGFIIALTIVVTALCLYYLSFTFVSRKINKAAVESAIDASGNIDFSKKQTYLDSVWREPVFNLFGAEYTFKEVKETELSLGLDLQGGMHVTLEISPIDLIIAMSGNSDDPTFRKALEEAKKMQRSSQEKFTVLFRKAFKQIDPNAKLAPIFANSQNRGKISSKDDDDQIMRVIDKEVEDAIGRSFEILRTRIDRFGTSQPNIQRLPGTGRIQIELPGVENQERVRNLLQGVAKLEFWEVYDMREIQGSMVAINQRLLDEENAAKAGAKKATMKNDTTSTVDTTKVEGEGTTSLEDALLGKAETTQDTSKSNLEEQLSDSSNIESQNEVSEFLTLINYPYGMVQIKDTSKVNKILRRLSSGDLRGLLPSNLRFAWALKPEQENENLLKLYALKVGKNNQAPLTGDVISDASQTLDERTAPAVSMSMNAVGARVWKKLTAENVNRQIAIALDGYILSAPVVRNEIPNGQSQISGNFTLEEAKDLASKLKAGALPAKTRIVEEAVVGPSLGKEAQKEGINSIVIGLLIVVVFMVAYYALSGMVANVALLFNIFFILGILAQFNAALTLPGIAGIVLTIGMAIDANVLIFERIKEELNLGRGMLQAISNGYEKAFSSIFDANVTTFITGFFLFIFGQGPVKGFATTLMIGIACSFFSAVYISRVITSWMTKKGDKSKLSFSTPMSKSLLTGLNFDFMGKRRLAYIGSSIFIVIGIIVLLAQGGLNYGVDFTGGRSYIVAFKNPVVASDIKASLSKYFEDKGTEAKTFGANNIIKITTSYLINDESSEADDQVKTKLIEGIEAETGLKYTTEERKLDAKNFIISGSSKVGATIADDIKYSSLEAIIFSLVAIFLYILVRFRRAQFGIGAIIALFHDTLFVIAAFAYARLFGKAFEVDQVFIAAMLTIIGYSINDTVVVFDRIRETIKDKPHANDADTFNISINETLSRTVITSLTTLLVVIILLIFGGEALRGFSFALFVGIVVGTYSSIFIATPVALDMSRKSLAPKGEA